jgi:RHS repeat-associated protein
MIQPGRKYEAESGYRYGFNGKENDNEVKGEGNSMVFENRILDTRLGKWLSTDPLESQYPWQSTYAYYANSPIAQIDYFGMGDYYDKDGKYLGADKNDDKKVFFAEKMNDDGTFDGAVDLGVTQDEFAGFASLVWNESGGNKDESFALANSVVNFIKGGGSTTLNSLSKVLSKANYYSCAVTQKDVDEYEDATKNGRHEISAVINALMRSAASSDTRFSDNTDGATHWDGLDLVVGVNRNGTKNSNSHRNYDWSEDSKDLLETYYKDYGCSTRTITQKVKDKDGKLVDEKVTITNDADPSKWSYKATGFDVSAKKIFGKSLFQKVTSPGEGYVKDATDIDYSNIKLHD